MGFGLGSAPCRTQCACWWESADAPCQMPAGQARGATGGFQATEATQWGVQARAVFAGRVAGPRGAAQESNRAPFSTESPRLAVNSATKAPSSSSSQALYTRAVACDPSYFGGGHAPHARGQLLRMYAGFLTHSPPVAHPLQASRSSICAWQGASSAASGQLAKAGRVPPPEASSLPRRRSEARRSALGLRRKGWGTGRGNGLLSLERWVQSGPISRLRSLVDARRLGWHGLLVPARRVGHVPRPHRRDIRGGLAAIEQEQHVLTRSELLAPDSQRAFAPHPPGLLPECVVVDGQ